MKAFVTGATGFVGSHVARLLHEQGASLRLLMRSTSRTDLIDALPADRVTADICDVQALAHAMQGCDAAFHVAADYRLWTRDSAAMYRTNVEGTRAIIAAAQQAGVRRVVYTSSVATIGFLQNGAFADEASPVALADMIGHYKRSKFMAEEVAIAAGKSGVPVVIVNPTTPIGEQDIKPTPTGRIIVDFLLRKFPAYVDTGLNLVDVREVARGHLAAFERARPGERYVLGGENLTLKQVLDKLAAITGLASPSMRVPHSVAMLFATLDETVTGRVLGREPRATREAVRMGRKKMWASSAKAERELGWRVVPIDDALQRAVAWFVARGYAPTPPKLIRAEAGVPA